MFGRLLVGSAAAAMIGLAATPAAAHWQWTKWGMSQAEVKAAGGEQVVEESAGVGWDLQIKTPYQVGSFAFNAVRFRFVDNKLAVVSLKGSTADFDEIEQAVSAGVGRPVSAEYGSYPKRIWLDRERGNTITLRTVGDIAVLDYKPVEAGF